MAGVTMVRARNADGTFMADDPSTPDVDEAWVPAPFSNDTNQPGGGGE
jgi:hypothetical protein